MEIFLTMETEEDLERIVRYNIGKAHQIRKEIQSLDSLTLKTENNKVFNEEEPELIEEELIEEEEEEYLYYYNNISEDLKKSKTDDERLIAISENLPSIENGNYANIINRIKLEYMKEIYELEELKKDETEQEFIEELNVEQNSIYKLLELLKQAQVQKVTDDTNKPVKTKNKLVFLKTHSGSTYAESDLYQVPEEYYESFKGLLLSIEEGTFKNVKQFSKNNNLLKGISEVKDFKTRILFERISKDTYVIIDIFMKKTDNDYGYRNSMATRVDHYRKNKATIIELIKDKAYMKQEQEIRDNLIKGLTDKNIVKTMKRG